MGILEVFNAAGEGVLGVHGAALSPHEGHTGPSPGARAPGTFGRKKEGPRGDEREDGEA